MSKGQGMSTQSEVLSTHDFTHLSVSYCQSAMLGSILLHGRISSARVWASPRGRDAVAGSGFLSVDQEPADRA